MQAVSKLPWEGDDGDYRGTHSTIRNHPASSRARRGKYRGNKVMGKPSWTKYEEWDVADMINNPRRTKLAVKRDTAPVTVIQAKTPDVVKMGLTNNIGADYSG